MRLIVLKYGGECRKCYTAHPVGATAIYEKRVGIFCEGCAPTDVEEIRAVRQEAADAKAERYEGWAEKREAKATRALNSHPEVRHDWAFITQPGHIPLRARMNAADDRAHESLQKAREMRGKAYSLRSGVRVAGDAERKRQARRDRIRPHLEKGMRVTCHVYGEGAITRVNKKTATVAFDRGYTYPVDLSWLCILLEDKLIPATSAAEGGTA